MNRTLLTVKARNLYGFIIMGICALALGVSWSLDETGLAVYFAALAQIAVGSLSFASCFSRNNEPYDEMAVAHNGAASSVALIATLIVVGLVCIWSICGHQSLELCSACCLFIGFGLFTRGLVFAWLERDDGGADNQNG